MKTEKLEVDMRSKLLWNVCIILFFIHFFDLMAIWEAMKIYTAMVPITNGSGIFRLFFLNFFLFNYVDEFFKFFNCFLFISLKQEIKISTVRRGEFKPVSSLSRKRQMRLFIIIIGHNQYREIVWGRLSASPWKEIIWFYFSENFLDQYSLEGRNECFSTSQRCQNSGHIDATREDCSQSTGDVLQIGSC